MAKARTAAQKAATEKMLEAAAKRRASGGKRTAKRKGAKRPASKRARKGSARSIVARVERLERDSATTMRAVAVIGRKVDEHDKALDNFARRFGGKGKSR